MLGDQFPITRWSVIDAVKSHDPAEQTRALDTLCTAYWKPVYKYVRLRWSRPPEDAQDLTQGFFAELQKRGGNATHVALDFQEAEDELAGTAIDPASLPSPDSLEEFFEKEWVRSLFIIALEDLRK